MNNLVGWFFFLKCSFFFCLISSDPHTHTHSLTQRQHMYTQKPKISNNKKKIGCQMKILFVHFFFFVVVVVEFCVFYAWKLERAGEGGRCFFFFYVLKFFICFVCVVFFPVFFSPFCFFFYQQLGCLHIFFWEPKAQGFIVRNTKKKEGRQYIFIFIFFSYNFPNIKVSTKAVKTNTQSSEPMRSPGQPKTV